MIIEVNKDAMDVLTLSCLYELKNDYQQRVLAHESSVDTMILLEIVREIAKRKDNLFII